MEKWAVAQFEPLMIVESVQHNVPIDDALFRPKKE